jgi:tetratricopeptide (TPR) repeat protein
LQKTGQIEESVRQMKLLPPQWSPAPDPKTLERLERPKDNYDGVSFRQLRRLRQLQAELKHSKLPYQEHAALHFEKAEQLLGDGFDREAIEELELVIDNDPQDARSYRKLAQIYLKSGRMEEALRSLTQSLRREETAGDHLLLGKIYLQQGKLEDAQAQLNAALGLEPASPAAETFREELNSKRLSRP